MGKQNQGLKKNQQRKSINNYNPYNILELNKFHQLKKKSKSTKSDSKRKRDLQRLVEYRKNKNISVAEEKIQQLNKMDQKINTKRKKFQKIQRKQHFISHRYQQLMNIQKRKIVKTINELKQKNPQNEMQIQQWIKKLNYIKYFPKNLKYVALFPTVKPLQSQAIEFQTKIMSQIQANMHVYNSKMNSYEEQNKKTHTSINKDKFFIQN